MRHAAFDGTTVPIDEHVALAIAGGLRMIHNNPSWFVEFRDLSRMPIWYMIWAEFVSAASHRMKAFCPDYVTPHAYRGPWSGSCLPLPKPVDSSF